MFLSGEFGLFEGDVEGKGLMGGEELVKVGDEGLLEHLNKMQFLIMNLIRNLKVERYNIRDVQTTNNLFITIQ